MSSSSVCQGLQSCLEPWLTEPRVLRLNLAPPGSFSQPSGWISRSSISDSEAQEKSNNKLIITTPPPASTNDEHDMKMDKNADKGGWSFLQSLSNTSHYNKTEEPQAEKVYVHPTVKPSSSMLSEKSLEMCTESLGCETGSNASEYSDDIALFSLESSTSITRHTKEASRKSVSKTLNRAGSFPPPLTSIRDLGGVQVRSHREDGRLILKAVATPSSQSYFQAERSKGRLRLRLLQTFTSECDDEVADDEGIGEEESNDKEEVEIEAKIHNQEDTEAEEAYCGDELEENNEIADDETGKRKLTRPRRCKESGNRNKGMLNLEAFWVAT